MSVAGIQELATPSGTPGAGARLISVIPPGRRIRRISIEHLSAAGVVLTRAQIATDITSYELRMNGQPLIDPITPAQIHALMDYLGTSEADGAANDGVVRLDQAQLHGVYAPSYLPGGQVLDGESLGLGTVGAGPIELHILQAGVAVFARARVYVEYASTDEEPGLVRRIKVVQESGWTTGKKGLTFTQRAMRDANGNKLVDRILGLHIIDGTATAVLSDVEIWVGNVMVQRLYGTTLARALRTQHRTQIAGWFHIELSRDGTINGGLPLDPENPAEIRLTFSTAPGGGGQFTSIYDMACPVVLGSAG